ncbi:hypothetical protein LSTR_LSTR002944 [Laodelphax striatellus]|uniref:Uncharacterized protein n=1 Tax=Laodelphax striatellus TaxID=195883 RepID=A0A482XLB5_LAOST|nr:hypothetical protein LSTR_LSTR002944 [Laodelphax striatellus]
MSEEFIKIEEYIFFMKIDGSRTNVTDKEEETTKKRPPTAIELLGHFQGLQDMIKGCLKTSPSQNSKKPSQRLACQCPSSDSFQANLNDVLDEIKRYEKNLVTQEIGEKRAKRVYRYNFDRK